MADVSAGQNTRKPIIAGNWKMHLTHVEAIRAVEELLDRLRPADYGRSEVVVCPPFTALRSVQMVLASHEDAGVALGAQDVHWESAGAWTGEVSAPMLARLGVVYVIVGHSERRQHLGETDETVSRKVAAVLAAGMTPIVCVGEALEERESGRTEERVSEQVHRGLGSFSPAELSRCVLAYEPIWAIGTGRNASPEDADATIGSIRQALARLAGDETAGTMRIQYGGSVKSGNIGALMAMPEIDGALVGGASLDPVEFARIVRYQAP
ncbi:MAG: triose-phosphate isomerase [Acidimicrobiia bacterium]